MSTILWSLSIWSKVERWKSSISECLTCWPQIKKIVILKCCLLLFYATTRNRFSIRLWCVVRKEKWIVYYNQWLPAQWLDQEAAPKHFPEPNLHQEEVMVIVWSGPFLVQVWLWEVLWSFFLVQPLNVWSTTTFWTLAKPWHLRSMLSKSMGCTENCNACSQFKRKGPFSTATLKHMPHNQHFKSGTDWAAKFCQIHHVRLASCQPTTTSSSNFLKGKMLPQTAENGFQEFLESWSTDFYATGINQLISCWQKMHWL